MHDPEIHLYAPDNYALFTILDALHGDFLERDAMVIARDMVFRDGYQSPARKVVSFLASSAGSTWRRKVSRGRALRHSCNIFLCKKYHAWGLQKVHLYMCIPTYYKERKTAASGYLLSSHPQNV